MSFKSKFFESPNALSGDITISGSIEVGAWREGYLGSGTEIILYPADFNLQNRANTRSPQTTAIELGGTNRQGANCFFPSATNPSIGFFAQKIIPLGFEAISAQVNGMGGVFTCYAGDITDSSSPQVSPAGVAVNVTAAFVPNVQGNGTAYVSVYYAPGAAGTQFFGAVINIRKI